MRPRGRPRKDAPRPNPEMLTKVCVRCGNDYDKPAVESWARWLRRKFCGLPCYQGGR